MSLVLRSVSKSFGALSALKSLTMEFQPGTVTAIVGDNGAGKSTLLGTLAGVHAPDVGTVELDGVVLTSTPRHHRLAGIEMVYQDLALLESHDVTTNLFLGREVTSFSFLRRKQMEGRTASLLTELGIHGLSLRTPVGLLSGGQKQGIAIGRAIISDAKVLLLDEPTAALGPREVERVLALIVRERERGRIVILVSHRLNDVFAVADRIVVLKQGTVVSDDLTSVLSIQSVVERIVS